MAIDVSPATFRGTVVMFAIDREAKPFIKSFADRAKLANGRWRCGDLIVDCLGVGMTSARTRVDELLATGCVPNLLVVAGFAGALRKGLPLGEVVAAAGVIDESGRKWATDWPAERTGRVLTCDQMIGEPEVKKQLGQQYQADVVEMESAAVAAVCRQHGIPFGCVRVVSDDVDQRLSPRLKTLFSSGQVSIVRVLLSIVRSPRIIPELIRLARQTRYAADQLARRLGELLK
ncbi:MAG: hypothetical protein K8T89_04240 [Planctomycetes bacterium]|nr:hypothetical protein [Planctomycetota bacterium]